LGHPLKAQYFACGRVLQFRDVDGKRDSRIFLAGLLDWLGDNPPTSQTICGARLLAHGAAHVRTISANNGQILGCRDLDLDHIEIPVTLSERNGLRVQQGFCSFGDATPQQRQMLPAFSTWGLRVVVILANDLFEKRTRHR
jgi:hypothetical protein